MRFNYPASLEGWTYIEVTVLEAKDLADRLLNAGAGFAVTSEPGPDRRRIYWFSATASAVIDAWGGG